MGPGEWAALQQREEGQGGVVRDPRKTVCPWWAGLHSRVQGKAEPEAWPPVVEHLGPCFPLPRPQS